MTRPRTGDRREFLNLAYTLEALFRVHEIQAAGKEQSCLECGFELSEDSFCRWQSRLPPCLRV